MWWVLLGLVVLFVWPEPVFWAVVIYLCYWVIKEGAK